MTFELMTYVLLPIVGLCTGILGGMLGIGGSIIMIPAMVVLLGATRVIGGHEVNQMHQYMAVAMIVNFLLSIPSVLAHWRNHAIWPGVVKYLALGGLVGVSIGVALSNYIPGRYLQWGLGVFFVYVAAENINRAIRGRKPDRSDQAKAEAIHWLPKLSLGTGIGVFAGLTGLGGGALAVPMQQYCFNIPIRNAIANSSAMIVSMAWLGAIIKNWQLVANPSLGGNVTTSLILAACLVPTAMIGSYIGGHLTHRLPVRWVRLAFAMMILASTVKMFEGLVPAIMGAFR
jgi:uncharacterized protein